MTLGVDRLELFVAILFGLTAIAHVCVKCDGCVGKLLKVVRHPNFFNFVKIMSITNLFISSAKHI